MTELMIGLLIVVLVALVAVIGMLVQTFLSSVTEVRSPTPTVGDLNKAKGRAGEAEVTRILQQLPSEDYELFTTVILPKQPDRSRVEMDQVVLSRFGVFVIETKRWGGRITGGEDGPWLQTIGRNFHSHANPFAQNERQVRRLRQHLDIASSAIRGVVCFVGDTELDPTVPANVVRGARLLAYLADFQTEKLNDEGIEHCREQLRVLARSHPT